jgi:predicted Zn-dependent protease
LFLAAEDESEFAGVLAQAIARGPLLDDWIKRNPASPPTVYNAMVAAECLHCVMPPAVLAERRKIELQTDKSAVLMMSRAGFDPAALLRYVERVQPPDAKAGVNSHFYDQSVSTFPARADRIAALQKALRGLPAAGGTESEEFRAIQEQVRAGIPEVPKPSGPTLSKPVRGALVPR